jgi:hypothetical protein
VRRSSPKRQLNPTRHENSGFDDGIWSVLTPKTFSTSGFARG